MQGPPSFPSSARASCAPRTGAPLVDRDRRRLILGVPALAGAVSACAPRAAAQTGRQDPWCATWGCAPAGPPPSANTITLSNQTVRLIARASIGAGRLRIRLSNEMGSTDLRLGSATIALRASGASVHAGTIRRLSFGGRGSIIIPAGAPALSDPVNLAVGPFSDLAVSLYFPGSVPVTTIHGAAYQASYVSAAGDHGAATALPVQRAIGSWPFLTEIDSDRRAPVIVAAGDSITDGVGSTTNTNRRWPDWLARRLQAELSSTGPFAVVNRGISGNRLLQDTPTTLLAGRDLLERFDRDVLATAGVRVLAMLVGINDIVYSPASDTVRIDDLVTGYRQLIERAHARGIGVLAGTLLPFSGLAAYNASREAVRQAANEWLRTSGEPDLLADFDRALRDPAALNRLRPAYDSGDHVHPNDAGYQLMAASVPLSRLANLALAGPAG